MRVLVCLLLALGVAACEVQIAEPETSARPSYELTTTEAYDANWKSARNFSEHNYLFGRLDWRKDRFASIVEQF